MYKHDEKQENLTKMEQIKSNIIIGLFILISCFMWIGLDIFMTFLDKM